MLHKTFQELGLSEYCHDIYIRLLEKGPLTARELAEFIGIPRPSVYDYLKTLVNLGLISESKNENKTVFMVADVKNLERLLSDKIETLESEKFSIEKNLSKLKKSGSFEPKIQFFHGLDGIKRVLSDFLWSQDTEVMAMWSSSRILDLVGYEFMEELNKKRIKRRIRLRGIWPSNRKVDFKKYPLLGAGPEVLRELRIAPREMSWDMSYRIYGDKVAFISSGDEMFAFIVYSRDFAQLLRTQFEVIWKVSKSIKS